MPVSSAQPLCPVFGQCGGCSYQHLSYVDELRLKDNEIRSLLTKELGIADVLIRPIVASPQEYHYRNRLDLKLKKTKAGDVFIGFTPNTKKGILPVDACYISRPEINDFIPQLKKEAIAKLTPKYRNANLTLRSGESGEIHWGGIGKKSCQLTSEKYFWTTLNGRKIFYSLDTFFQANLSILPKLMETIKDFNVLNKQTTFFDLYGGVGLFSLALIDEVKKAILIENCLPSIELARYNANYHQLTNIDIVYGTVDEHIANCMEKAEGRKVAMIDPPRAGLSADVSSWLAQERRFDELLYLSCHPQSLARDLKILTASNWKIVTIIPFDFFPKTPHIETLVLLQRI